MFQPTVSSSYRFLRGTGLLGSSNTCYSRFLFLQLKQKSATTAAYIHHSTTQLSPEGNKYRSDHEITVSSKERKLNLDELDPVQKFEDAPFSSFIVNQLKAIYPAPTPIQAQSWPIIAKGYDIVSVAKTGSGKTCGFVLPAIEKLYSAKQQQQQKGLGYDKQRRKPQVLILCPVRELAHQIYEETKKFAEPLRMSTGCFYGGTSRTRNMIFLSKGCDIVIATPGRCEDLRNDGSLDLSDIKYLVLDEADRMLDMGFETQIKSIIGSLNPQRQNLFFTATWPTGVQSLTSFYMKSPVTVNIGEVGVLNANKSIAQHIYLTKAIDKFQKLETILEESCPVVDGRPNIAQVKKTLIFVNRKDDCDQVALTLRDIGYSVGTLHGDKDQRSRDLIMNQYRGSKLRILVATDVAARGLDITDIEAVINFDFPQAKGFDGLENYIHRIGRTARGGRNGVAHSFLAPTDYNVIPLLVDVLKRAEQSVPNELLAAMPNKNGSMKVSQYGAKFPSRNQRNIEEDNFDPILGSKGSTQPTQGKRPQKSPLNSDLKFGNSKMTSEFNLPDELFSKKHDMKLNLKSIDDELQSLVHKINKK